MTLKINVDVERAQELLRSGLSLRKTAQRLGISDATLRRRLAEPNGTRDAGVARSHIQELEREISEIKQRVIERYRRFSLHDFESLEPRPEITDPLQLKETLSTRGVRPGAELESALERADLFARRVLELKARLVEDRDALKVGNVNYAPEIRSRFIDMLLPRARDSLNGLRAAISADQRAVVSTLSAALRDALSEFITTPNAQLWCELERVRADAGAVRTLPRAFSRESAMAYLYLSNPNVEIALREHDPITLQAMGVVTPQLGRLSERYHAAERLRNMIHDLRPSALLAPLRADLV
jgi:transposase-like protein